MLSINSLSINIEDPESENEYGDPANQFVLYMSFNSGYDYTEPSEYLDKLNNDPSFQDVSNRLEQIRKIAFG